MWLGEVWSGTVRQGRHGVSGSGVVRRGEACHGMARQAGLGLAWSGAARMGEARQGEEDTDFYKGRGGKVDSNGNSKQKNRHTAC